MVIKRMVKIAKNIGKKENERREIKNVKDRRQQSKVFLYYTLRVFFKLQSINLEAAFKLAKSLSEERYDFVKKLAPMGK